MHHVERRLRRAEATPAHVAPTPASMATTPRPEPPDTASRIVPIESLLYDVVPSPAESEPPVVPIESLAYDAVPIESLAYDAPAGGLEGSYSTFDRLRRERVTEPASLEALVGRALAATTPAAADPHAVTVEIGVLCYSGRAALERANAVRQQLADELARHGGLESIRPLLQELLDLVPLALAES